MATTYDTKDGKYHFEYDYFHETFDNSNGVGHTYTDSNIEVVSFTVYRYDAELNDDVEVTSQRDRELLLLEYNDELIEQVAMIKCR
jgi:kynureninase